MPPEKRPRRQSTLGDSTGQPRRPRRVTATGAPARASSGQAAPAASTSAAARREAQRQARRRAPGRRKPLLLWIVLALLAALAVIITIGVIINIGVINAMKPQPGAKTPDDGRDHIQGDVPIGQTTYKPYSTDPPTSGAHWNNPAAKGIYQEMADERLVHSLEHGYVVIHHNCAQDACPELYQQLTNIYLRYDRKVALNYRPQTDSKITLTAWTRMDKFADYDEARIVGFIDAYRGKIGPEKDIP